MYAVFVYKNKYFSHADVLSIKTFKRNSGSKRSH